MRISRYASRSATSSRAASLPAEEGARAGAIRVAAADDSFSISRALACADNPKRFRPTANASLRRRRSDIGRLDRFRRVADRGKAFLVRRLVTLGKTEQLARLRACRQRTGQAGSNRGDARSF